MTTVTSITMIGTTKLMADNSMFSTPSTASNTTRTMKDEQFSRLSAMIAAVIIALLSCFEYKASTLINEDIL